MEKKVIDGVREYYQLLDDVTDKQIEQDLKGSFGEACVNIGFAQEELRKAFSEAMPNIFKKYFRR